MAQRVRRGTFSAQPQLRILFSAQEFGQFGSLIENYAFSEAYDALMAAGERHDLTKKTAL